MAPPYSQFAGKPDPWPGDVGLQPNEALKAAYVARYGHEPGNPAPDGVWIPGCANESFWINEYALANYYASIGQPGRRISYTEQMDCAWGEQRWNAFYKAHWYEHSDGGSAEMPIHVTEPTLAHGPFTRKNPFHPAWLQFYFNDYAGAGTPPAPPPDPTPTPTPEPPPAPSDVPPPVLPHDLVSASELAANWSGMVKIGPGRHSGLVAIRDWLVSYAHWQEEHR